MATCSFCLDERDDIVYTGDWSKRDQARGKVGSDNVIICLLCALDAVDCYENRIANQYRSQNPSPKPPRGTEKP